MTLSSSDVTHITLTAHRSLPNTPTATYLEYSHHPSSISRTSPRSFFDVPSRPPTLPTSPHPKHTRAASLSSFRPIGPVIPLRLPSSVSTRSISSQTPQGASAGHEAPTSNAYTIDPPSQSQATLPSHAHDQLRKMRTLAISLGVVALLCASAIICILVRFYKQNSSSPEPTAGPGLLSRFVQPAEPEASVTNTTLPSIDQLSWFSSAERRILQTGRSRSHTVGTHHSFHSADVNSSALSTQGSSSPEGIALSQRPLSSPIDQLTGEFASALSRAFGSVRLSRPFPVSPCLSDSPKSGISTSKQPHQRPEACDGFEVESQCGSIGQAHSLADELGGESSIQFRKSVRSSSSMRSSIADMFRLKPRSSSSNTPRSHPPESMSVLMDASTSSPGLLPTPHPEDMNVLFSASQDSIAIGMPSVPPSSLVDSEILLKSDIPRSPMDIPFSLLTNSSLSPPRRNGDMRSGSNPGDHTESNALRGSLLFDPSLAILPPASPSSDGVGLTPNVSSGFIAPMDRSHRCATLAPVLPPSGIACSNGYPKSRISPPALHSPSGSIVPSPVLVASLTSESLALAEAIDNLEAEAIYASFPSTPSNSSPQSLNSVRSRRSPGEQSSVAKSPFKSSTSEEFPLSSTSFEPEGFSASLDISCAMRTESETFNQELGDSKFPLSPSLASSLSLSTKATTIQNMVIPSIPDEVSLGGVDISDAGLYSPCNGASVTPQFLPSSSSPPGKQCGAADIEEAVAYTPQVQPIPAMIERSLAPPKSHFIIPQVVIQSTSEDDTSGSVPSCKSSLLSTSSSRLAVSVIPEFDEATELIERTLQQIQQRILSYGNNDNRNEEEEEDDELESFEGDISLIYSPPGPRQAASAHSSDEDDDHTPDACDEVSPDLSSHYVVEGEEVAYEFEVERRLHSAFPDVDEFGHNSNLAYFNYSRPLVPRPSEVAFRAIMNEGRIVEVGHVPRYLGICKENFVPAVSSPLRASHRASSAYSESGKSRVSDGSVYSQSQVSEGHKMSPSWSSVF